MNFLENDLTRKRNRILIYIVIFVAIIVVPAGILYYYGANCSDGHGCGYLWLLYGFIGGVCGIIGLIGVLINAVRLIS